MPAVRPTIAAPTTVRRRRRGCRLAAAYAHRAAAERHSGTHDRPETTYTSVRRESGRAVSAIIISCCVCGRVLFLVVVRAMRSRSRVTGGTTTTAAADHSEGDDRRPRQHQRQHRHHRPADVRAAPTRHPGRQAAADWHGHGGRRFLNDVDIPPHHRDRDESRRSRLRVSRDPASYASVVSIL